LRLAVETSSLVSLEEKRPSLLTIPSQRRSRSTPPADPFLPPKQSETERVRRGDHRKRGRVIGEGGLKGHLVEGGAGGERMEMGRPVEECGEGEIASLLPRVVEAQLRLHPAADLLRLHHLPPGASPRQERERSPRAPPPWVDEGRAVRE
jgi:hypothetical protein